MRLTPLTVALIYLVCSVLWIVLSDMLLHQMQDPLHSDPVLPASIYKGIGFVTVSAVLIYLLSSHHTKKLEVSLHNYQQLFEHSPFPMYIADTDSLQFLAVNDACTRQYGYTREEFMLMTLADIRPQEDIPLLKVLFAENRKGFVDAGHWKHIRKNGELIHVHITYHDVEFNNKNCLMVHAKEISTQYRAEIKVNALYKELSEFKNAISSASLLLIANHEGRIELINENLEHISKHAAQQVNNHLFTEVITGLRDVNLHNSMWQMVSTGQVWNTELCNTSADGGTYWTMCYAVPIADNDSIINKIVFIQIDITDRKKSDGLIQESNRHLAEIAWISSHQLRHPVANLMGLLELLNFNMSEGEKEDIKLRMNNEMQRLDEMIRLIVEKTYQLKDSPFTLKN